MMLRYNHYAVALTIFCIPAEALANNTSGCSAYASLTQKNQYRNDAGLTPVDNDVTEGFGYLNCSGIDAFLWTVHNNNTGNINELELSLGYSFAKNGFDGRVSIERWFFFELEAQSTAFISKLNYRKLPVTLGVQLTKLVGNHGTEAKAIISKPFNIGSIYDFSLTLTPTFKMVYTDEYYGVSGHSNNVYSLSLDGQKGRAGFKLFVNEHDGKGVLDNSTQVGMTIGHSF